MQLLEGRPGNSIDRGDVGSMQSAAVHGMRSRAILFVDAAQQQWQILHSNEKLAEVGSRHCLTCIKPVLWTPSSTHIRVDPDAPPSHI